MENYIPKEEAKGYIVIDVDTSQVVEATKKTKKTIKTIKESQLIDRWIGFKRNFT